LPIPLRDPACQFCEPGSVDLAGEDRLEILAELFSAERLGALDIDGAEREALGPPERRRRSRHTWRTNGRGRGGFRDRLGNGPLQGGRLGTVLRVRRRARQHQDAQARSRDAKRQTHKDTPKYRRSRGHMRGCSTEKIKKSRGVDQTRVNFRQP